jgi:hypothetical protein
VLRIDARVQAAVPAIFWLGWGNFLSTAALCVRVSPLSLLRRESFGSPLFLLAWIADLRRRPLIENRSDNLAADGRGYNYWPFPKSKLKIPSSGDSCMGMPAVKDKRTTLTEADTWFNEKILPKRTTRGGFSANRLWKSPSRLVTGNTEDPDGLCGDAASYVYEQFWNDFGDYTTTDGRHIGLILWRGAILNHIAAVMLATAKIAVQTYRWDAPKKTVMSVSGNPQYSSTEVLTLHVYDLYYKKKQTSVESWWKGLDARMGGIIKLALMHTIED